MIHSHIFHSGSIFFVCKNTNIFENSKINIHFGGENDGIGIEEDVGVGGDDGGCHGDDRDND